MGRNAAASRRGNQTLQGLKQSLRRMPTTFAIDVAAQAGPALTDLARDAYGTRSVYGDPNPIGADGQQLDLYRTGAVAGALRFGVTGTVVKCELGEDYAKYLIGKYSILPNGPLPTDWKRGLDAIVKETRVQL